MSTAKFRSRIATRTEENKNTYTNNSENTGFFGYQKNSDIFKENAVPSADDPYNFEEEKWITEKTLNQNRESLKNYENEKKHMDRLIDKNSAQAKDPHKEPFEDEAMKRIAEIDNKKRALSEIHVKPKKNLNSIVSKATPFTVDTSSQRRSEADGYKNAEETCSNKSKSDDRTSVDVWRASQPIEPKKEDLVRQDSDQKDQILDQWLSRDRDGNATITEDVDAEDREDSSRMSQSTVGANDFKTTVAKPNIVENPQNQNEEEEENELHKIHMLQSLQALQYMKKVRLPPIDELRDKMVFLPPPKNPNIKKTLIFDMDETLIH
eukprot:CAMPEP_0197003356 /NCGR_PEP_ID=MMETSP1380-20130617/7649_1 /TAXON_ID=5936 /ORGANISM="Euplotes crassus, Strain CT5" /LENGTH=321 /DNA_ID=CAMNT_0042421843 /DNA_START=694 /DNA_END=1659 /DNA_ORIENTATION=-